MTGRSQENPQKTTEKIFKESPKPFGKAILPLYVIEILLQAKEERKEPVTVSQLQKMIRKEKGRAYYPQQIERALMNLHHHCNYIMLEFTQVHATRSRAWAFSIKFKTSKNSQQCLEQ